MEVCVINQPKKVFTMECHICVIIQSDLSSDCCRNFWVSLSSFKRIKRSAIFLGRIRRSHRYHWNEKRRLSNKAIIIVINQMFFYFVLLIMNNNEAYHRWRDFLCIPIRLNACINIHKAYMHFILMNTWSNYFEMTGIKKPILITHWADYKLGLDFYLHKYNCKNTYCSNLFLQIKK